MTIADVVSIEGSQAVKLPDEFRVDATQVSIRKQGQALIVEPIRAEAWPVGFFEDIRIEDASFTRPPQGTVPPVPTMDSPTQP